MVAAGVGAGALCLASLAVALRFACVLLRLLPRIRACLLPVSRPAAAADLPWRFSGAPDPLFSYAPSSRLISSGRPGPLLEAHHLAAPLPFICRCFQTIGWPSRLPHFAPSVVTALLSARRQSLVAALEQSASAPGHSLARIQPHTHFTTLRPPSRIHSRPKRVSSRPPQRIPDRPVPVSETRPRNILLFSPSSNVLFRPPPHL